MSQRLRSRFANVFSGRKPFSPSRSRASAKPRVKRLGIEPLESREMLSISSLLQSLFSNPDRYERDNAPAQAQEHRHRRVGPEAQPPQSERRRLGNVQAD